MRKIGKSDLFVSELTLGTMSIGTDKTKGIQIINHAIDEGINHIDTADLYDFGINEQIVGEAIKGKRENIILTTKVGNHFNKERKDWFWDPSKKYIKTAIQSSLKRLQTDYIDLYLLHGGTINDPIDETIEAFEELKQAGYIRAYGISSIRPNVIREYVKKSSIDAVMTQYNLLDRRPEEEILDLLYENNIGVLARGPLAKGILSKEAVNKIEKKAENGYLDYTHDELISIYNTLNSIIPKDIPLNHIAIQYVLKHPAVASTVFGASSVEQVAENTGNIEIISENLYETLGDITSPITYKQHR